jgi:hypothetical protein
MSQDDSGLELILVWPKEKASCWSSGADSMLLTDGQLVPLWRQELGNFPPTVP